MAEAEGRSEGNGTENTGADRYAWLYSPRSERVGEMQRMFPILSRNKSVTFADVVTVRYQSTWSEADYRAARRGPWMTMAVDRHRFRRRIEKLSKILTPILTDEHRIRIRLRNLKLNY